MADKPTDSNIAEVLAGVRQQRLENAVDELMAAEQAGTLGKAREQVSRSDAHQLNERTLADEYQRATAPGPEAYEQPPLIENAPQEQTLVQEHPYVPPMFATMSEAAVRFGDAWVSTRTGVADALTFSIKAVQNMIDARDAPGPLAAAGRAMAATLLDGILQIAMPPGTTDTNLEELNADTKQAMAPAIDASLGTPPDEGPVSY